MADLIQEHVPPPPQVTPQHLATLLGHKARLDKSIQEEKDKVSKARLAVAEAEDDLSILQQEKKGLVNQIDPHHREDDARRERSQGGNDDMEGVFVEEADSGEEVCVQAHGGKRRKVGKGRFGGGLRSARGKSPARLLELLHGMSEEDQATFKRNTRLKRSVFNLFKPGEKCLRSAFFVGSGTRKEKK